jgi:hypothetical protein
MKTSIIFALLNILLAQGAVASQDTSCIQNLSQQVEGYTQESLERMCSVYSSDTIGIALQIKTKKYTFESKLRIASTYSLETIRCAEKLDGNGDTLESNLYRCP